jgi:hypothetical protein
MFSCVRAWVHLHVNEATTLPYRYFCFRITVFFWGDVAGLRRGRWFERLVGHALSSLCILALMDRAVWLV